MGTLIGERKWLIKVKGNTMKIENETLFLKA
jgi:hypothetical protein